MIAAPRTPKASADCGSDTVAFLAAASASAALPWARSALASCTCAAADFMSSSAALRAAASASAARPAASSASARAACAAATVAPAATALSAVSTAADALALARLGAGEHGEGHGVGRELGRLLRVLQRVGAGAALQVEGSRRGQRGRADVGRGAGGRTDRRCRRRRRLVELAGALVDAGERGLRLGAGDLADDLLHGLDRLVGLAFRELLLGAGIGLIDPLVGGGGQWGGDQDERQGTLQLVHGY